VASMGVATLVVGVIAGVASEKAEARVTEYAGTVVGDPLATVSFTVEGPRRKPRTATFAVSNLQLFYDDGTTFRESFAPRAYPFISRLTFKFFDFNLGSAASFLHVIEGRLLRGGRAVGSVLYMKDIYEPGTPGVSNVPDSSTLGPVQWEASATG